MCSSFRQIVPGSETKNWPQRFWKLRHLGARQRSQAFSRFGIWHLNKHKQSVNNFRNKLSAVHCTQIFVKHKPSLCRALCKLWFYKPQRLWSGCGRSLVLASHSVNSSCLLHKPLDTNFGSVLEGRGWGGGADSNLKKTRKTNRKHLTAQQNRNNTVSGGSVRMDLRAAGLVGLSSCGQFFPLGLIHSGKHLTPSENTGQTLHNLTPCRKIRVSQGKRLCVRSGKQTSAFKLRKKRKRNKHKITSGTVLLASTNKPNKQKWTSNFAKHIGTAHFLIGWHGCELFVHSHEWDVHCWSVSLGEGRSPVNLIPNATSGLRSFSGLRLLTFQHLQPAERENFCFLPHSPLFMWSIGIVRNWTRC